VDHQVGFDENVDAVALLDALKHLAAGWPTIEVSFSVATLAMKLGDDGTCARATCSFVTVSGGHVRLAILPGGFGSPPK